MTYSNVKLRRKSIFDVTVKNAEFKNVGEFGVFLKSPKFERFYRGRLLNIFCIFNKIFTDDGDDDVHCYASLFPCIVDLCEVHCNWIRKFRCTISSGG